MLIHCPREDLGPQAKRVRTQEDVETQRHEDTGTRRHMNTVTQKHRYTETHGTYVETWTRDTGMRRNEDTEIKSRDSTTATDAAVDDDVNDDEYAIEWFESQREVEREFHPTRCLERQIQVLPSSRCVLVSWLIPVRRHLSLSLHSLSLALSLLDRFLARVPLASDCLQLLGVACLHIAAKQVEVTAPRASQLLDLCGRAFTTQQLKNLERLVLLRLKFRLLAPTAADFLSFYLSRERGEAARGRALGEAEMEASLSPPPSPLPLASSSVAASSISKLPPSTAAPTTLSPPPSPQLLPQTPSTERGCTLSPPTSQQPPPLPPHPSSATTKGSVVRCFLAYNYDSNPNRYPYPNHTTPTNHNSTTTSTTTEKSSLSPVCSFSALSCLSEQILELSFADYAFNAFPASTLALAALEVASRLLGWSGTNDGDTRRKKLPLKLSRALWLDCVGRLCLLVSLNQNILPTPHELGLAGTSRFYDLDM